MLRANQRDGYAALMKATAEAIIELARDRRHVGGTVGVMAVLLDAAAPLPPACALPRHRRRCVRRRPQLASRPGEIPGPDAAARRPRTRQNEGRIGEAPTRSHPAPGGLEKALGHPLHALGKRCRGSTALSRTLRFPRRHHRGPHRWARRHRRHNPLQASQIGTLAHDPPRRPRVHASLPPARPAEGPSQSTILGPMASEMARSCSPHPTDADPRSRDNRQAEPRRRRAGSRGASWRHIAMPKGTSLPELQRRPPPACAQALPQAGAWTMSRRNNDQPWPLRVSVTLRLPIVPAQPAVAAPPLMSLSVSLSMPRNHRARHQRANRQARSSHRAAISRPTASLENP